MTLSIILIQLIGVMAWGMLMLSYYRKNTNKILIFQIAGTLLYCVHYWLLGAYSGLFMCFFEAVFDYGYYKTDKDKYIYLISVPVRIGFGLFTFKKWVDVLPIVASLIDGYTLTKKKKVVVFGAIISYSLWFIYNIFVGSYSGAITDLIIVVSNLSIWIFNYRLIRWRESRND